MGAEVRQALRELGWRYLESPARKTPRFERLEYPDGDKRSTIRRHWYIRQKATGWVLQSRQEFRFNATQWRPRTLDLVKPFATPTAAATFFALHHGR